MLNTLYKFKSMTKAQDFLDGAEKSLGLLPQVHNKSVLPLYHAKVKGTDETLSSLQCQAFFIMGQGMSETLSSLQCQALFSLALGNTITFSSLALGNTIKSNSYLAQHTRQECRGGYYYDSNGGFRSSALLSLSGAATPSLIFNKGKKIL